MCVPQDKGIYEKIGEATEVALKVLAEKLNVQGLAREEMSHKQKANVCFASVCEEFEKV